MPFIVFGQLLNFLAILNIEKLKFKLHTIQHKMKKISSEEVKKVAKLARLELDEAEIQNHAEQLEKILGYIKQLDEINTENTPCTTRAIEVINVFRKDERTDFKNPEQLLDLAPSKENKFFKVPKIISE